jgi:hypothetical protein
VLSLARTYLRMDVAWLAELHGDEQVLTHSADPEESRSSVPRELGIGAYVGVPVRTPDGSLHGMLCCVSETAQPELTVADVRVLEMLAGILGELAGNDAKAAALETVRLRTNDAIVGRGRTLALQPIVDVPTGIATGVEALARFDSPQATEEWFTQAEPVGLRLQLELAAARTAHDIIVSVEQLTERHFVRAFEIRHQQRARAVFLGHVNGDAEVHVRMADAIARAVRRGE